MHKPLKVFIFILCCLPVSAIAGNKSDLAAHVRMGMVSGSFVGSTSVGDVTGNFSTIMALDLEGEYHQSSKKSLISQTTLAMDDSSGALNYVYLGFGQKYYFNSRGNPLNNWTDNVSLTVTPRIRYFANWDLGISRVLIEKKTESLSSQADLLDYGVSGGLIRSFGKNWGVEAQLGYSCGFPISSIAIESSVIKVLIGVTSYF